MRPEKETITEEIRRQVNRSPFVLLADFQGMTVEQTAELRRRLRPAGAEFHVVKNRLFRRVAQERQWGAIEAHLEGPSAMIVGEREVAAVARVVAKFAGENQDRPVVKAGMMGDRYLAAAVVGELARLPSREVLLGMLAGAVAAPMTRFAGALRQTLAGLAYVLKAVEEKKRA